MNPGNQPTLDQSPFRPAFSLRYERGEQSDIVMGHRLLPRLGQLLVQTGVRRAVLCSDDNVLPHYGPQALESLGDAGITAETLSIPAGEDQKTLENVSIALNRLAALRVERGVVLVALGGGVVGDLFGFVASSYLRGLPLVQIPTTIVAQVDSSIGGKVGVDLPAGKNLVGAFKHATLVAVDFDLLRTLPDAEWIAGAAEVLKHGVIADARLFEHLEAAAADWRARTLDVEPILTAAIAVKARLVQQDEREQGPRMFLNYGHTAGHALEAAAEYRGIRHGEAVGWGMAIEARIAAFQGVSSAQFVRRQDGVLRKLGLLQPLPPLQLSAVYDHLFADKKIRAGHLRWALPGMAPGEVSMHEDVPLPLVRDVLGATLDGTLPAMPLPGQA